MIGAVRAEAAPLGWLGIMRLGLVQAALGAIVVLVTSTLNRVMVVEYGLPAMLPGVLVALHYGVQMLRPRFGHGSDQGRRRTPWIVIGMLVLAAGGVACTAATVLMPRQLLWGLSIAVPAYAAVGMGVGAAGTSLLALLANQVAGNRRAAAASIMWIMMIAGFAVTSSIVGRFLDPFTPSRLIAVNTIAIGVALVMALFAVTGMERAAPAGAARDGNVSSSEFGVALRRVWSEPRVRRFTWFVFFSMLAYSAQELLLEPFAGLVFGYSLGASARLSGLWHASALVGMVGVAVAGTCISRFNSLRVWIIGGCCASAAALLSLSFAAFDARWPLRMSIIVLGLANGTFAVAAIGTMLELSRRGEIGSAGIRMGLWGAAQAVAFALGGLCGNLLIDLVRHLSGSAVPAYAAVFAGEAALFCVAAALAVRIDSPRTAPLLHTGAASA